MQDSTTNRGFQLLSIVIPGSQPSLNDSLVTIGCVSRVTLQIVSILTLPLGSSLAPDLSNMIISIRGSTD